jgi:hypothetical protein
MVQHMAKKICFKFTPHFCCNRCTCIGQCDDPELAAIDAARAALEAMREPTEADKDAAGWGYAHDEGEDPLQWWQAMISAALSEPHVPQA